MATSRRKLFTLFIISTILLQFVVELCDARRSTRVSPSRRISTRRYSRTSLTRSTLQRKYGQSISLSRNKISSIGWKQALVAGGLLYIGSRMYMSRRMYYSHPYRKPTICSNFVDADENGTVYKMFICPRHYESDNQVYCCGPEGQQKCCAATKTTGSIVGIVIGTLLAVGIIAGICYCVCRKKKRESGQVIIKDGEDVILGPPPVPMPPPQPMPMGYGPHPGMMPPPPGMGPNQAQQPMYYGSTYGQPSYPPPPAGYPYPAPPPGEPMPGPVPPPYPQPVPTAPVMPPGVPPGMPPQQPPPPGFYTQGPPPSHPPPPYTMT